MSSIAYSPIAVFALHVISPHEALHWPVIALIAGIGILGSLIGAQLSTLFSPLMLRRSFAGFLVLLGGYILATSLPQPLLRWSSLWHSVIRPVVHHNVMLRNRVQAHALAWNRTFCMASLHVTVSACLHNGPSSLALHAQTRQAPSSLQ